jgi:hypothetical protein
MAFYGLNVFSETPKRLRKGRMRYIVASVVITCLTAFAASLDMAVYFQVLFASTSPSHWRTLMLNKTSGWEALLSGTCVAALVWIGDALLVSGQRISSQCIMLVAHKADPAGLPLLCDLG